MAIRWPKRYERHEFTFRAKKPRERRWRKVSATVLASNQLEAFTKSKRHLQKCGFVIKHSIAPFRDESAGVEHYDATTR